MVLVVQIAVILILRPILWMLYRPRINEVGIRIQPLTTPSLFVANHVSYIDAFLFALLPLQILRKTVPIYFPTTQTFMSKLRFRWVLAPMGAYTVHKWSASLAEYLQPTIAHLQAGHSVLLFPEGGHVQEGTRRPGKPGVGLLREQFSELPVIPVRIRFVRGTRRWPLPKLHVTIGPASTLKPGGSTLDDYNRYADALLDEIYALDRAYDA